MENVVAELREKLERRRSGDARVDGPEARLRRACSRGSGHVVVTGSDRAEIHALLTRVLDAIEPLRAVRTLAVDSDPYASVDRVISALDADIDTDTYLDRSEAMLALLARAKEVDKSIFLIVDDADRASVEELEQLRSSLDVTPESFERLRLVLVGDDSLVCKLENSAGGMLGAEITACVSIDERTGTETSRPLEDAPAFFRSRVLPVAVTAAVALCATAYSLYATGLTLGGAPNAPTPAPAASHASRTATWAIRGDEPFLHSELRIVVASSLPATETVTAPKPTPMTKPPAAAPVARSRSASTPVGNTRTASAAHPAPKPQQPARAAGTVPSPGSSIDSFMKRFPTTR